MDSTLFGLDSLIDALALLENADVTPSPERLHPGALWLIPEGAKTLPESHRTCVVDRKGKVQLC